MLSAVSHTVVSAVIMPQAVLTSWKTIQMQMRSYPIGKVWFSHFSRPVLRSHCQVCTLRTPVTGERRGMITKRVRLRCSAPKHSQEVQREHCSPFTAGTFLQMVENKPHNTSYTSLAEWNGVTVTPLGHWIILNADIFPAMFSTLKSACIGAHERLWKSQAKTSWQLSP